MKSIKQAIIGVGYMISGSILYQAFVNAKSIYLGTIAENLEPVSWVASLVFVITGLIITLSPDKK